MARAARITGTLMIVAGPCSIGWALLVWQWQDPFTAIYAKYEQHKLASSFAHRFADYKPPSQPAKPAGKAPKQTEPARTAAAARAHRLALQACHPRFFASHRYIAYAKLVRVEPRDGEPYTVAPSGPIA